MNKVFATLIMCLISTTLCADPLILNTMLSCGAVGDGIIDDAPALQSCINRLESAGGGQLLFPGGHTYLLDSFTISAGHSGTAYNLIVGSNIRLDRGGNGIAVLLQGPNGYSQVPGVGTITLVFGKQTTYPSDTFQIAADNGGFYNLGAIASNDSGVTFATPANAGNFAAGDYVAIYSSTTGDVIPGEISQAVAADAVAGTVTLKYQLARSFATPVIAKVTSLATVNVGISGMIVQGRVPLSLEQVFGFTSEHNQYIADANYPEGMSSNTVRGFTSRDDLFTSVNGLVDWELPQRDSADISFSSDTFIGTTVGFGEYGIHWNFDHSKFWLAPVSGATSAINLSGYDVIFSENTVYSGPVTGSGGALLQECISDNFDSSNQVHIEGNIFHFSGVTPIIRLNCQDTLVAHNHLLGGGIATNAVGTPQCAKIIGNYISTAKDAPITLTAASVDCHVVMGNHVSGGTNNGIFSYNAGSPSPGGHAIIGNQIDGYSNPVNINTASHPGSLILDQHFTYFPNGKTCAGTPSSSFASVNGVITAC